MVGALTIRVISSARVAVHSLDDAGEGAGIADGSGLGQDALALGV
jgi:hypothetical protein